MTEESSVDRAITAANHVIACYEGMIAGLVSGAPLSDSQLIACDITENHRQKLFDALDQVAAELVTLDEKDEFEQEPLLEWEKQLLDPGKLAPVEKKPVYHSKVGSYFPPFEKDHAYGTPVASTVFIPMSTPGSDPPSIYYVNAAKLKTWIEGPGYTSGYVDEVSTSGLTYDAVQKALEEMWKPGWQKPELTQLTTKHTPYESSGTISVSGWSVAEFTPNTVLEVNGEKYLTVGVSHNLANGSYGQLTVDVVKVADFTNQVTQVTDATKKLVEVLEQKPPEPWYAHYNKPVKGKK